MTDFICESLVSERYSLKAKSYSYDAKGDIKSLKTAGQNDRIVFQRYPEKK